MSIEDVRAQVRQRYEQEFQGYERVVALIDGFLAEHKEAFAEAQERDSSLGLLALMAKARKTTHALYLLAKEGFGEDALILARSLVSLAVNLAYIAQTDSDQRAKRWVAFTKVQRARLNRELGEEVPEIDPDEYILAEEWKRLDICARAKMTRNEHLYAAYRHASSYEHSDAWAAADFVPLAAVSIDLASGPSGGEVGSALYLGAVSMISTVEAFGKYGSVEVESFWWTAMRIVEGMVGDRETED